jgi:hypothetical protein
MRETPSEDKARMFIALLHQAHDGRPLSQEYLVELQNSVLTNPFDKAFQYRTEQNWLRGPARGAPGVTPATGDGAGIDERVGSLCEQRAA